MSLLSSRHRASLSLAGAAAFWAFGTVVSKRAVTEIAPVLLLPIQLTISLVFSALAGRQVPRFPRGPLRSLGWLGVLNPGVAYSLSLMGLSLISASRSVLLWALEPVLILLLARAMLGEKISAPTTFLSGGALFGVTLVLFDPAGRSNAVGVALTLAGVASCAVYTVLVRRSITMAQDASSIAVVTAQQLTALVFAIALLAATAQFSDFAPLTEVTPVGWLSAFGSGVSYYAIAFWLYLSGLRQLPASIAGLYLTLIPVFGILASRVVLGEHLTMVQWIGSALTVLTIIGISTARPQSHR